MPWLILAALAVIVVVSLLLVKRREPPVNLEDFGAEEIVQAAAELHEISRRLEVAQVRHDLRGETHRLRRELDKELRAVEALESSQPSEE